MPAPVLTAAISRATMTFIEPIGDRIVRINGIRQDDMKRAEGLLLRSAVRVSRFFLITPTGSRRRRRKKQELIHTAPTVKPARPITHSHPFLHSPSLILLRALFHIPLFVSSSSRRHRHYSRLAPLPLRAPLSLFSFSNITDITDINPRAKLHPAPLHPALQRPAALARRRRDAVCPGAPCPPEPCARVEGIQFGQDIGAR